MDAADGTSIVLGSTTVGLLIKEFFAWRRYRARAVALALFDAVESPAGWLAWKPREGISTNKKED